MDKKLLLAPMKNSMDYKQLLDNIKAEKSPISMYGLNETQKSHIAYGVYEEIKKQVCIVVYNEIEARQIYEDLKFYVGEKALYFPSKEVVFYNLEATSEGVQEERMKAIERITEGENCIVVTSIDAFLHQLLPPSTYTKNKISFEVGEVVDLSKIVETFTIQGYERMDIVEERGQFSIRGDIIDVFPGSRDVPVRIELFGDEVDSIREFEVETQRSMEKIESVKIYAAKETVVEVFDPEKVIDKLKEDFKKINKKLSKEAAENLKRKLEENIEKIKELGNFKGVDKFLPYIYEKQSSLLDYFSEDTVFLLDEPTRLRENAKGHVDEFRESFKILIERGEVLPTQGDLIIEYDTILDKFKEHKLITSSLLPKNIIDFPPKEIINFDTRPMQSFHSKIDLLVKEIERLQYKGYKTVLIPGTKERAIRLLELLKDRGVNSEFLVKEKQNLVSGQVVIIQGNLRKGFEYVKNKYAVITDYEIYGVHKKQKRKSSKRKDASPIKSFIDLKVGDYVVHEGHGIGKYVGIEELKVDGMKKDYLKIKYSGEGFLYVPTDQMDLIQKYIGSDEAAPKLNKLGGTEWARAKTKAKKSIEDMAQDLIKLYAEREKAKGYAFGKDTDWQKQFEDLFPYEETPDQLKCIEEVKMDMEKERPMDRLLCGDVGYGKTEVAIRAAFKAVADSKQVAFLVPTTILAQQHYNTFKQRFSGFPINVEMLSRFKSPSAQKKIIEDARTGNVDIIIGTHRLLSKDTVFKDLGLLIIDEEQRFGVKHKETLKKLKSSIDVLTLTATPIPRTLHMSMIGIRDMSVIEDPPEERFPVQTYVLAHNESMIADAISRELSRDGQVYYVYNRVQSIHTVANKLAALVPQSRVAVAHGQMSERELEKIMLAYMNGEYDVLVSTTIIETGMDISNVNTIIIQDADRLGLSQLYQLRGRVGRSNRQSYAYLMYEKNKILSEVADKRLKAIKEFTEFGSGFKIAMRDLEIRGAGNLLGGEQHGHMAAIGYDLYVKLLGETVDELRGEYIEKLENTAIELSVNAYISEGYIANQGHKIEIYKKIASIRNLEDMYKIEEEIEDRFGDIPLSVRNLLLISYIKALAKKIKIEYIIQKDKDIRIQFKDSSTLKPEAIGSVLHKYNRKVTFNATAQPYFIYKIRTMDQYNMLNELRDVIEKISGFQAGAN